MRYFFMVVENVGNAKKSTNYSQLHAIRPLFVFRKKDPCQSSTKRFVNFKSKFSSKLRTLLFEKFKRSSFKFYYQLVFVIFSFPLLQQHIRLLFLRYFLEPFWSGSSFPGGLQYFNLLSLNKWFSHPYISLCHGKASWR